MDRGNENLPKANFDLLPKHWQFRERDHNVTPTNLTFDPLEGSASFSYTHIENGETVPINIDYLFGKNGEPFAYRRRSPGDLLIYSTEAAGNITYGSYTRFSTGDVGMELQYAHHGVDLLTHPHLSIGRVQYDNHGILTLHSFGGGTFQNDNYIYPRIPSPGVIIFPDHSGFKRSEVYHDVIASDNQTQVTRSFEPERFLVQNGDEQFVLDAYQDGELFTSLLRNSKTGYAVEISSPFTIHLESIRMAAALPDREGDLRWTETTERIGADPRFEEFEKRDDVVLSETTRPPTGSEKDVVLRIDPAPPPKPQEKLDD